MVNGGITKPYAHKSRDDYQNEEEILLLVQFPLLLFWWEAYSPERNLCSNMKTVVDPHSSAHTVLIASADKNPGIISIRT